MTIAILAMQGAFLEHGQMLDRLGVEHFEIRKKEDLDRSFDGLILPGGESTVQGQLLKKLDIFDTQCLDMFQKYQYITLTVDFRYTDFTDLHKNRYALHI